jgi:hypothetical protein
MGAAAWRVAWVSKDYAVDLLNVNDLWYSLIPKMPDSSSLSDCKKFAIRAFFGGLGFAVGLGILVGAGVWYSRRPERPKPWNNTALKATYDTMEFSLGASKDAYSYPVDFYYNVHNNTDRNYQISSPSLTPMAVLTDGNALSKQFGHHQSGDATFDGPAFIPPGGTARVEVKVAYFYPPEFTSADKNDPKKISANLDFRLRELSGFVVFDEQNHYRLDLPEGWKQMKGVQEDSPAASNAKH